MQDLDQIGAAIETAFPKLARVRPIQWIAEGSSSNVVETDSGLVFRIAKTTASRDSYQWEAHLLPEIAGQIDFSLPDPRWHVSDASSGNPCMIGYRKLPGQPIVRRQLNLLDSKVLHRDLCRFMCQLHACELTKATADIAPLYHAERESLIKIGDVVLPRLERALSSCEFEVARLWLESMLDDRRMQDFDRKLIHGDLFYGNVLVDTTTSQITGVIDFENASLGDPAQDIAVQYHLGHEFGVKAMRSYLRATGEPETADFEYRVRQLRILREFSGMRHFLETDDDAEFSCCVAKLRQGPLFET